MLDVKIDINLGEPISYIGKKNGAYPNKEYISENTFIIYNYDDEDNYNVLYGFKNNQGKQLGQIAYIEVTPFIDGLAWVFNKNGIPVLLNKNGKEVLYSKKAFEYSLTRNLKVLEKEKKEYLKAHKAYAKKNKFEYEEECYVVKNKKKYGLKSKNGTTILPAIYDDIYVCGDIIVIEDKIYSYNLFKPKYDVTITHDELSVTETYDNYCDAKNYINKFKKEFESNLLIIHEEFERMLKEIQIKEAKKITKSFYDADKKVQSEVLKHKKGKK